MDKRRTSDHDSLPNPKRALLLSRVVVPNANSPGVAPSSPFFPNPAAGSAAGSVVGPGLAAGGPPPQASAPAPAALSVPPSQFLTVALSGEVSISLLKLFLFRFYLSGVVVVVFDPFSFSCCSL